MSQGSTTAVDHASRRSPSATCALGIADRRARRAPAPPRRRSGVAREPQALEIFDGSDRPARVQRCRGRRRRNKADEPRGIRLSDLLRQNPAIALELTSARRDGTNGSSNTSISGSGPASCSAPSRRYRRVRSRAWSNSCAGCTAELHRGKNVDADAAVRLRFDGTRPRHEKFRVHAGYGGEGVMELERDLRRVGAREAQNGRTSQRPPRSRPESMRRPIVAFDRPIALPSRPFATKAIAAQFRRDGRSSSSDGPIDAGGNRRRDAVVRSRRCLRARRASVARSRDRTSSRTATSPDRPSVPP